MHLKRNTFLTLIGLGLAAQAQANLLTNGSFEQGVLVAGPGGYALVAQGSTNITGWTITHGLPLGYVGSPNTTALTASDGSRFLDLTGESQNVNERAWIQQSVATVVGGVYQLSFDLGSSAQYGLPAEIDVSTAASLPVQSFISTSSGLNVWQHEVMRFVAVDTQTTLVLAGSHGQSYIGLDNVALDVISLPPPVPEPAVWALWVSGLLVLLRLDAQRRVKL